MKKTFVARIVTALAAMLLVGVAACADFNADAMINVISREDGSGTRGAFIELMGIQQRSEDGTRKDLTTQEATIVNKTDIMLTAVASDPAAIGYVSLGSLNDSVKALDIDGVAATAQNIIDGGYAVSRPFLVATKGEPEGLAKDFIDFILSTEGQEIVAGGGYIAVNDDAVPYAGDLPSGKIVVAGSSSVTPIMEKLQEAYLALNGSATIEIQLSDSSAGMSGAIDGTCDIGMSSRDLKDEEKEQLADVAIAMDGIAVIVNPSNPLTGLTSVQVRAIFIGEVEVWSEV